MKSFRDPVDEWLKATIGEESNRMVTMLDKLTDQQFLFCQEYVKTGSPHKAAKKAKLPKSANPHMMVHLPKVAACINILNAKRDEELGKKSTAEVIERLNNTPLLEDDDFNFSEDAVQEREDKLAANGKGLKNDSTNELLENIANPGGGNGIMQLPKVKVPQAQSFGPQWIIERFVTVAERCLQIEPVYDRKGRPIGQFKFEANAALKALEMLGKTMAMFRDRVEVAHEVNNFSDEELDSRLKVLAEQFPEFQKLIDREEKVVNAD